MASPSDICNVALANIGHKPEVVSIDPPDGGAYATHCARFFAVARDMALEEHAWTFAVARFSLAQDDEASVPDRWEYGYVIPSDMIRPIAVFADDCADETAGILEYEIEGSNLFCNEESVTLKYIFRADDTSKWTPSFANAVSWKLAVYLSGSIVKGDAGLRQFCEKMYQQALAKAMGFSANSSRVRPEHIPVWMRDR